MKNDGIKSSLAKFFNEAQTGAVIKACGAQTDDLILIVADKDAVVFQALGALRLELGKKYELFDKTEFNFTWITEFPLLEFAEEENRYVAAHHPFTSPMDEDLPILETDPGKVRASL